MGLLIMVDALLPFRKRRIDVRSLWGFLSEREFRGLSSNFGAARKYCSGWIGELILIGWKCSATLTVKLNYAPNKNSSFFLLHLQISRTTLSYFVIVGCQVYLPCSFRTSASFVFLFRESMFSNKDRNTLWQLGLLSLKIIYSWDYQLSVYQQE